MRFAVTGGAGFVGSNLVKLLVKKGHDISYMVVNIIYMVNNSVYYLFMYNFCQIQ